MVSDDEDLEVLRLAALKSRKRKLEDDNTLGTKSSSGNKFNNYDKSMGKVFHKRHKIQRGGVHRSNMNSRVTTNLISVPIANKSDDENEIVDINEKLIQNKANVIENSTLETSSKFNRYNHSDKSESESESDKNSNKERSVRGDSLDRLMDELENEIAGGTENKSNTIELDHKQNNIEKQNNVSTKKKMKQSLKVQIKEKDFLLENASFQIKKEPISPKQKTPELEIIEVPIKVEKTSIELRNELPEQERKFSLIDKKFSELSKPILPTQEKGLIKSSMNCGSPLRERRSPTRERKSPFRERSPLRDRKSPTLRDRDKKSPFRDHSPLRKSPIFQDRFPLCDKSYRERSPLSRKSPIRDRSPYRDSRLSPVRGRLTPRMSPGRDRLSPYHSPTYRPRSYSPKRISPLIIDTEVLNTITMAPLSPRSAAFVLQNREILAKRKLSPHRRSNSRSSRSISTSSSYSRSPTPRKRSISPMYSRSRFIYSPPPAKRYSPSSVRRRSISPLRSQESIIGPRRTRSPTNITFNVKSPYKRRSLSPKSSSFNNTSPQNRRGYNRRRSKSPSVISGGTISSRATVHGRLGHQSYRNNKKIVSSTKRDIENKSPIKHRGNSSPTLNSSPNLNKQSSNENKQLDKLGTDQKKFLDPVLEARRRKFESNKPIEVTEGIIKLKPVEKSGLTLNEEKSDKKEEDDKDDDVKIVEQPPEEPIDLDETEDTLYVNAGDLSGLWSTDESDNENEGRFKNKTSNSSSDNMLKLRLSNPVVNRKVSLEGPLESYEERKKIQNKSKQIHNHSRKNRRKSHKLSVKNTMETDKKHEDNLDSRIHKISDKIKMPERVTAHLKERSSDIKKGENMRIVISEVAKPNTKCITNEKQRKVTTEVIIDKTLENQLKEDKNEDEFQPEIVYEDEEDSIIANNPLSTTVESNNAPDDLRTELSRRRAQRKTMSTQSQINAQLIAIPPTRLLQTAFQEMSKKSLTSMSAVHKPNKLSKQLASKQDRGDVKLPIHLRLGTNFSKTNSTGVVNVGDDETRLPPNTNKTAAVVNKNKVITNKLQTTEKRNKKRIVGLQV